MRKIICLLSVFLLMLFSCSKSEIPEAPTGLLKKIIKTDSEGIVTTSNFNYNGNKLVDFTIVAKDYTEKSVFTYSGDLISKIVTTQDKDNSYTTEFIYENGKLTMRMITGYSQGSGYKSKTVYTYVSDEIITFDRSVIFDGTAEDMVKRNGVLKYLNGNLIKSDYSKIYLDNSNPSYLNSATYEFDNKKNPLKNILGYDKMLDYEETSVNNIVKNTNTDNSILNNFSRIYKYNSSNYPIEQEDSKNGKLVKIRYFYE